MCLWPGDKDYDVILLQNLLDGLLYYYTGMCTDTQGGAPAIILQLPY